jgi:hypothetical protein
LIWKQNALIFCVLKNKICCLRKKCLKNVKHKEKSGNFAPNAEESIGLTVGSLATGTSGLCRVKTGCVRRRCVDSRKLTNFASVAVTRRFLDENGHQRGGPFVVSTRKISRFPLRFNRCFQTLPGCSNSTRKQFNLVWEGGTNFPLHESNHPF